MPKANPIPTTAANPSPAKAGHIYVAYADQIQNADPNELICFWFSPQMEA